ncbi:MAG TPA: phytoene/squalene synthase family protein [Phycisphaerales bacterium]|nr:phytoene/squalene synthase family protein [Phycisphaerales bacterium]
MSLAHMNSMHAGTDEAMEYCRAITQKRARNFYYGLRLSPEPARSALYTVYAWMRKADDLVDGDIAGTADASESELREKVARFREATDEALSGGAVDGDLLWVALGHVASRHSLRKEHFHAVLDGQLDDLTRREYATFAELKEYCRRVASAVGLLCVEIWGYKDDRALVLAEKRGIAFQLTNILRDFRQDWDMGRIYLPAEDFSRNKLTAADLHEWRKPHECELFLREQIERAEAFYQSSDELESLITPAYVPTLAAMTAIYHGLLKKMRGNPASLVEHRRIRLSTWQKAMIALRAKWSVVQAG